MVCGVTPVCVTLSMGKEMSLHTFNFPCAYHSPATLTYKFYWYCRLNLGCIHGSVSLTCLLVFAEIVPVTAGAGILDTYQ